jgi:hypothetical protein
MASIVPFVREYLVELIAERGITFAHAHRNIELHWPGAVAHL